MITCKAKHNAPVFGDPNRLEAVIVASKRMESQSWKVNVLRTGCLVKYAEDATQLRRMVWVDFGSIVVPVKLFEALVAYFENHRSGGYMEVAKLCRVTERVTKVWS